MSRASTRTPKSPFTARRQRGPARVASGAGAVLALALLAALSVASPPAGAVFPGLNGRIACEAARGPALPTPPPTGASRSEIVSVNPDGGGDAQLTSNGTRDGDPQYSPDGTKVAFEGRRVADQPDNSEIYVANNDGDLTGPDVVRLTFNNGELAAGGRNAVAATDRSPSWSPDGTEIVFHSGRETTFTDGGTTPARDFEIYKMSATTGELGGLTRLTAVRGQDAIPSWSPDGTKIAFQTLRENSAGKTQNLEIYTMNPDGSGQTNISNNPGTPDDPGTVGINENSNAIDSFPTGWSPDSRQIAFGSTRDSSVPGNQNFEIYRMNRDGSGQTRLTSNLSGDTPFPAPHQDYDHAPTWSPDGTEIIFTSGRNSTVDADDYRVYAMDSSAGEPAGLREILETDVVFGRCDWQALARPGPPVQYPAPPARVLPFTGCPSSSSNSIVGSPAADVINGTAAGDRIFVGTGNDRVDGLGGADCIDLGPGNDRGQGGSGNDLVLGGQGADIVSGSSGNDRLRGNSGDDRIDGGRGNDRLIGDSGHDRISGSFGNDRIHGVAGRDRIAGSRGRDRINGGKDRDRISGGSSSDVIRGDQGSDRINGNSGSDRISGNSGNDRINGSSGNDRISGGSGRDRIRGGSGRDRIKGGSGNDRIAVRDGRRDRVNCGSGRDRVKADAIDVVASNCEVVSRSSASAAAAATRAGALGPAALIGGAYAALLGWRRRRA